MLIVYQEMFVGGSTTSLLSLLNMIDYSEYNVDLLLFYNSGVMLNQIPESVHLLKQASITKYGKIAIKFIRSMICGQIFVALWNGIRYRHRICLDPQTMAYTRVTNSRKLNKHYNVAIGYLEGFPFNYVALKVDADVKIGWIHLDPKDSYLIPRIDKRVYKKMGKIVFVSEVCRKNFLEILPHLETSTFVIENFLSSSTIRKLSHESPIKLDLFPKKTSVNLISVCRIVFSHKGLDRVIHALDKIRKDIDISNFAWYIIGDGKDYQSLMQMVKEFDLEDNIILLGEIINPHPYVKLMDAFILPSRFEGKPMAVTEALMLGIPAIVTHYQSAPEQVTDGVDGLIIDNSVEGIYNVLREIVSKGPSFFDQMKINASNTNYSNSQMFSTFMDLISE